MKIHYFQHVPFEGLALIEDWAHERKHEINRTCFFKKNYCLPELHDIDLLIVLGGPMSVHDEIQYPWMKKEKAFIKSAIDANKCVVGICLGAQMIAQLLGAKVANSSQKEIGWFPVTFKTEGLQHPLLYGIDSKINAFHWHGEFFEIPENTVHIATSEACENQGFIYNDRVLALQFHIEMNKKSITEILRACSNELIDEKFVQSEQEIMNKTERYKDHTILYDLLDNLVQ